MPKSIYPNNNKKSVFDLVYLWEIILYRMTQLAMMKFQTLYNIIDVNRIICWPIILLRSCVENI